MTGLYCLLIVFGSMLGGFLPRLMNLSHRRMQMMISVISGLMLGIATFHMWPHALEELNLRKPAGPRGGTLFPTSHPQLFIEVVRHQDPLGELSASFGGYQSINGHWNSVPLPSLSLELSDGHSSIQPERIEQIETSQRHLYFMPNEKLSGSVAQFFSKGGQLKFEWQGKREWASLSFLPSNSVHLLTVWFLIGLISMFFLLRTFHFHFHGNPEFTPQSHSTFGENPAAETQQEERTHDVHVHAHHDCHHHGHRHLHKLSWLGVFSGLAIHTLIDGFALAATIQAEATHGGIWYLLGFGTFLAIFLHKPLDAVSITSLMTASHWSTYWQTLVNACFALMCPLGAVIFFLGIREYSHHQHLLVGCALAASCGVFICIALGDLLPEVEFHSHDRFLLSVLLIVGILVAFGLGYVEPGHLQH